MSAIVRHWARSLSFLGKVHETKQVLAASLWYHASFQRPSQTLFKQLTALHCTAAGQKASHCDDALALGQGNSQGSADSTSKKHRSRSKPPILLHHDKLYYHYPRLRVDNPSGNPPPPPHKKGKTVQISGRSVQQQRHENFCLLRPDYPPPFLGGRAIHYIYMQGKKPQASNGRQHALQPKLPYFYALSFLIVEKYVSPA